MMGHIRVERIIEIQDGTAAITQQRQQQARINRIIAADFFQDLRAAQFAPIHFFTVCIHFRKMFRDEISQVEILESRTVDQFTVGDNLKIGTRLRTEGAFRRLGAR
jgi:hypothetical protein